jgi:protein arginine N-methyltransferase 7
MDEIRRAVRAARYNEVVVVNMEDDEGTKREIVLACEIDKVHGGLVWQVAADDSDPHSSIIRHLRTKKWILPMLNDETRNTMYQDAIQKACEKLASDQLESNVIRILDIGSGTGLLAMMGFKHLREALDNHGKERVDIHVVSLEMASAMATLAKQVVDDNGMLDAIEIRNEHSCETTLDGRAMLCTSELLESGLLGEGILPALRDAWNRHLCAGARIVPQRARVYAQLVESQQLVADYQGPPIDVSLADGVSLRLSHSTSETLLGDVDGIMVTLHAESLFEGTPNKARVLTEPVMVMDFCFSSPEMIPDSDGRSRTHKVSPIASGTAHGVLFWWELDLWDGITYSTQHGKQAWQDHWHQCLHVFARKNERDLQVSQDMEVTLTCHHNDARIWFSLDATCTTAYMQTAKRMKSESGMPRLSPFRAAVLADNKRLRIIRSSLESILSRFGRESLVLDVSDFSVGAMLAAVACDAKQVVSLESHAGELPAIAAQVAQLGNQLPRTGAEFSILQCHPEDLSVDALGGSIVKVVVGEPYYELLEGWTIQEALNFFFLVKSLKDRSLLDENFVSVPSQARVMACCFESHDIYNAYTNCGENVGGFNHKLVNELAARYHLHDLSIPLWQHQYSVLSPIFELITLKFDRDVSIERTRDWLDSSFKFTKSGVFHGIFVWVEYDFPSYQFGLAHSLSTKGRPYNQIVRLASCPDRVSRGVPAVGSLETILAKLEIP